jgi:hypothetical protein
MDELNNIIAAKVSDLTGSPIVDVTSSTRLYHDAGLSGEEYWRFLEWLHAAYAVELAGLDVRSLSPSEDGFGKLWPKRYLEVTVSDVARLIGAGSWQASGLASNSRAR